MKKILLIVTCLIFWNGAAEAAADVYQEYNTARKEFVSAWMSLATYNDRIGRLARNELVDLGWDIENFSGGYSDVEAKFIVAENKNNPAEPKMYMLAVTGTETKGDADLDLRMNKVFFGGTTPAEFVAQAQRTDLQASDPMVHRGFNTYTQAAFFPRDHQGQTIGEAWAAQLKADPQKKLYLTGHSLGGAVATLAAARLMAMGVNPAQLEVISFGAPAVGNEAFGREVGSKINLDRVVIEGDPVKSVLQVLRPDYTQFGAATVWKKNRNSSKFKHDMVVYVDAALRNYYDAREKAAHAGVLPVENIPAGPQAVSVYIAPFVFHVDDSLASDVPYMKQSLQDVLRRRLPGCVFGEGERLSLREEQEKARVAGCRALVLQEFSAGRMRQEKNMFEMTMQEDICDLAGQAFGSLMTMTNTRDFTPIEALLHNVTVLKAERERVLHDIN